MLTAIRAWFRAFVRIRICRIGRDFQDFAYANQNVDKRLPGGDARRENPENPINPINPDSDKCARGGLRFAALLDSRFRGDDGGIGTRIADTSHSSLLSPLS